MFTRGRLVELDPVAMQRGPKERAWDASKVSNETIAPLVNTGALPLDHAGDFRLQTPAGFWSLPTKILNTRLENVVCNV